MNSSHLATLSKVLFALMLVHLLAGCTQWITSERYKVVREAHEALCKENDFAAMKPFLSKNSLPLLNLTSAISNFGDIFIEGVVSDRIAVECHGSQLRFVDEIKVNDKRYIVRTRSASSQDAVETVVLFEDGKWKIALLGR